jgi:phage baseplate assembly protein W
MRREILGRGWKFPVQVDARGRIAVSEADEDIREAIRIILGTARGERVMRPEFGCGIYNYIYAQVNTGNLALIENAVREALETWEPRIDVIRVKADPSAAADGKLLVTIDYTVRSTNTPFNLVFPFYLKEGW